MLYLFGISFLLSFKNAWLDDRVSLLFYLFSTDLVGLLFCNLLLDLVWLYLLFEDDFLLGYLRFLLRLNLRFIIFFFSIFSTELSEFADNFLLFDKFSFCLNSSSLSSDSSLYLWVNRFCLCGVFLFDFSWIDSLLFLFI